MSIEMWLESATAIIDYQIGRLDVSYNPTNSVSDELSTTPDVSEG